MNKKIFIFIFGLMLLSFVNGANDISVAIIKKDINSEKNNKYSISSSTAEIPISKIIHNYSTVNGFILNITEKELKDLEKNSNYKIYREKTYYTNLDFSVPQINVNNVWKLKYNNINLTGNGQTICVIDTGVNYSHEAFGNCYGNNNVSSICKIIGGYDFVNNDEDPMDDQGHGTHVTGIIASGNNTYKGIAHKSKIISIKSLDNTGSGSNFNIAAGIDWCVSNSSKFNISVISMSIGDCSNHSTYCNEDYLSSYINAATAKNISVVVSAGNGPSGSCSSTPGLTNTDGPSSPACIENATAVGRVDDNDSISLQRGALFELMAPGVDIMSSVISGGYENKGGTSMAAPHVSGLIAIINQYLNYSEQSKNSSQIKFILNDTGKILNDTTGSGYNFSRVDAYNAILSLDIDSPEITLISPSDNHINLTTNQTFICNATDWQLSNITLKIWNSTGLYYNITKNLTGTSNQSNFTILNIPENTYYWNCLVNDNKSNSAFYSQNFSLIIGGINVDLNSPINGSCTNINETNFNCSSSTDLNYELNNITFYLWNSTSNLIFNETRNISGSKNTTIFNYNFSYEENYLWKCLAINNNSDTGNGVNYSIIYDKTIPIINSITNSVSSSSATINWNTNELSNSSISLNEGSWSNNSNYSTNHSISISGLSSSKNYNYNINSCDRANNCNNITNNFTTSIILSSSSGGGGGSSSKYTSIDEVNLKEITLGTIKSLEKNSEIKFSVKNKSHELKLNKINYNNVNITISNNSFNIILYLNIPYKINLNKDNFPDLELILISIKGESADIFIKEINEEIKNPILQEEINNKFLENKTKKETNEKSLSKLSYLFIKKIIKKFIPFLKLIY